MITLKFAQEIVEKVHLKARELGIEVSVAVVDKAGTLILASKMDNAISISPKFAYTKAFTAASLGVKTSSLAEYTVEKGPYYGLNTIFAGELTSIAGGVPIMVDGKLLGGVGVGGSMDVNQDEICADFGLAA